MNCQECAGASPPPGGVLDRLAALLESDGSRKPSARMVDLSIVLDREALSTLPEALVRFYENPLHYEVSACLRGGRWSRLLVRLGGLVSRQALVALSEYGVHQPVCQWLYEDLRRRTHWDRFVCARGGSRRLFVARMESAPGHVRETFVLYGLPAALTFSARVEGRALVLELVRRLASPLSWLLRVRYRTELTSGGLVTQGDFEFPWLGLHVQTEFRAVRRSPG